MTKEQIVQTIVRLSSAMGLEAVMHPRGSGWKADVLVRCGSYSVAFNVGLWAKHVEEQYRAMRGERVCGCWLLMPASFEPIMPDGMPCFRLVDTDGGCYVFFNGMDDVHVDNVTSLADFVPALLAGHIVRATQMTVCRADVCFVEARCWKCHKKSHVYYINRLHSADGISVPANIYGIIFKPQMVAAIASYLSRHPELGITMGEIKARYSKAMGMSYTSFGCAHCDSIFGNHFMRQLMVRHDGMTYFPETVAVDISEPFVVPVSCWYKKQ